MSKAAGTITKHKLADGRISWGYSFFAGRDEAGKRVQPKKGGFETRKDAADALSEALAKHNAAPDAPPPEPEKPVTYGEVYEQWLAAARQDPDVRLSTVESYEMEGKRLLPHLGEVPIQEIDTERLDAALKAIRCKGRPDKPIAPKSLRNTRGVAYGVFQLAIQKRIIVLNPVSGLKRAKSAKRAPRTLKPSQIALILQAAHGTDLLPVIALALNTGMRRGEIVALHWPQVDFENREILVKYAVDQTSEGLTLKPPKNGNERVIPFGAILAGILERHHEQQKVTHAENQARLGDAIKDNGLVFPDWDGGLLRPDLIGERVINLCKIAKIKAGLHTFRHQFATDQIGGGTPIADVAEMLGHSHAGITLSIYTHAVGTSRKHAVSITEGKYGAALERLTGKCNHDVTAKPVSDWKDGSSGRTRTYNPSVNSRMLYH